MNDQTPLAVPGDQPPTEQEPDFWWITKKIESINGSVILERTVAHGDVPGGWSQFVGLMTLQDKSGAAKQTRAFPIEAANLAEAVINFQVAYDAHEPQYLEDFDKAVREAKAKIVPAGQMPMGAQIRNKSAQRRNGR